MRYASFVLLALCLLATAAAPQRTGAVARAPDLPLFSDARLSNALGHFDARPGAWVEYAVLPKKGPQTRLRIGVLAPALPDGRYWLEIQSQQPGALPVAMKMLLHGEPGLRENLEKIYLLVEGLAPMELPLDELPAEEKPPEGPAPKVAPRGPQELKLAIGTFRCEELRVKDARVFRSGQVPLWGLVREVDSAQRIELVGYGSTGAASVFPAEFDQGSGKESVK